MCSFILSSMLVDGKLPLRTGHSLVTFEACRIVFLQGFANWFWRHSGNEICFISEQSDTKCSTQRVHADILCWTRAHQLASGSHPLQGSTATKLSPLRRPSVFRKPRTRGEARSAPRRHTRVPSSQVVSWNCIIFILCLGMSVIVCKKTAKHILMKSRHF